MPINWPKCKITVLKRTLNQDLVDEYMDDPGDFGPCPSYHDGQEFVLESPFDVPEGFCPSAWASICNDILAIATGSNPPWMNRPGTTIAGCSDWFRPVIFKVERLPSPAEPL
jgi:uncharacterized repeat protein (TIGR04076 family)